MYWTGLPKKVSAMKFFTTDGEKNEKGGITWIYTEQWQQNCIQVTTTTLRTNIYMSNMPKKNLYKCS